MTCELFSMPPEAFGACSTGKALDGGAICAMFAATYPERVTGLLLWSGEAAGVADDEYPWAASPSESKAFNELIAERWGDEDVVEPCWPKLGSRSCTRSPRAEAMGPIDAARREQG